MGLDFPPAQLSAGQSRSETSVPVRLPPTLPTVFEESRSLEKILH